MLTSSLPNARAWRASTIDDASTWYYPLSERSLAALEQLAPAWRQGQPVTEVQAPDDLHVICAADMEPVLAALETGRGFAVIVVPRPERFSPQDLQAFYWLVGQLLGQPADDLIFVCIAGEQDDVGVRTSVAAYLAA